MSSSVIELSNLDYILHTQDPLGDTTSCGLPWPPPIQSTITPNTLPAVCRACSRADLARLRPDLVDDIASRTGTRPNPLPNKPPLGFGIFEWSDKKAARHKRRTQRKRLRALKKLTKLSQKYGQYDKTP